MLKLRLARRGARGAWTLAICLAFCACSPRLAEVDAEFIAAAATDAPPDPDQLRRGRELYALRCAGCHRLPLPSAFTKTQMEGWLSTMLPLTKSKPADAEAIRRYALAAARPATTADSSASAAAPASRVPR